MLTLTERTMLGDIPDDWDSTPLRSLLSSHYPGDWGAERGPHMVRVLRSTNLTNEGSLNLEDIAIRALEPHVVEILSPKRDDVLLERSGGGPGQPVGRIGVVEDDLPGFAFSNFLHLLRPNAEAVVPSYLAWLLYQVNRTGRIVRLEQQTTQMRNLNFRDYLVMPLPLPRKEEQRAIADVLGAVDAALRAARRSVEAARRLKRALLQNLLVSGLRRRPTKKTAIGPIPDSWEVRAVGDVVEAFQYGLSMAMHARGQFPILRMGNIQHGGVVLDDLKYVDLDEPLSAQYLVTRGDVLFNRTNSQELVGKIGIYRHDLPAVFASYLIRLVPNSNVIDPYFLGHVLNSYTAQCRIKRFATPGVQQVNINATNLAKVMMPLPVGPDGQAEQQEIAAVLEAADTDIRRREVVVAAFVGLKRALLADLLTGHKRIACEQLKLEAVAS